MADKEKYIAAAINKTLLENAAPSQATATLKAILRNAF
jgi:hypothetical protein